MAESQWNDILHNEGLTGNVYFSMHKLENNPSNNM